MTVLSAQNVVAASLTVAWDPVASVAGYVVSYGTQSGFYPNKVNAGLQTSQQVTGLADGTRYYFIVQSFDSSGTMSPASAEVSGVTPGGAPTIICPAPSATSPDGKSVSITFSPTVAGGTAPVTSSCTPSSGSLFPVGSTSLKCTATDAGQRSASCASTVVVTSTAPALGISCPAPTTATLLSGTSVRVDYPAPTTTGGVLPVTTTCTPASGGNFAVGTTSVLCTATDASAKTAQCQTSVTVTAGATPPPSAPKGPSIEFDAVISAMTGKCPAVVLTVPSYAVSSDSTTTYDKGSCAALATGKNIHVKGVLVSTGKVTATAITFLKK